jgi:two-component system, chemotaxis family, chemotaxis protein CheY
LRPAIIAALLRDIPAGRGVASRNSMEKILVVDDSPTIRRMVRASLHDLEDVGFAEAGSGLEALERLAVEPVSMLILDLNMPDMHGLEVLEFLRRHQTHRATPVIVLTTRGDESSRAAALAAGANEYVTKPFVPRALASVARHLLDGSRSGGQSRPAPGGR